MRVGVTTGRALHLAALQVMFINGSAPVVPCRNPMEIATPGERNGAEAEEEEETVEIQEAQRPAWFDVSHMLLEVVNEYCYSML